MLMCYSANTIKIIVGVSITFERCEIAHTTRAVVADQFNGSKSVRMDSRKARLLTFMPE